MNMNISKAFLSLKNFTNLSLILRPVLPSILPVRCKGVARNTRQKTKPPGVKRLDGDYVRRGEILVVQFPLNFHPGLNVDIDSKNTLLAMVEGRVMMTVEKINPKKESYTAQKYYANMAAPVIYKRFFHVIPFKQSQKFKLVNLV